MLFLSQAGIDPHSVLEQLDPLLGQTGCIKSVKEVGKIVRSVLSACLDLYMHMCMT